jgi:hypothetical protein
MKNAIIFYGFQRSLGTTYSSLIKNIINRYDCDIYGYVPMTPKEKNYFEEKNFDDKIVKIVTNKNYSIDEFTSFIIKNKLPKSVKSGCPLRNNNTISLSSMFYNLSQSVKIFNESVKESKTEYKRVILTRPDLIYYDNPDALDKIMVSSEINCINFSLTWNKDSKVGEVAHNTCYDQDNNELKIEHNCNGLFNDQFLVGDHKSISKLSQLYDEILDLVKDNVIFDNETMVSHFLLKKGIKLRGTWLNNFTIHRVRRRRTTTSIY